MNNYFDKMPDNCCWINPI